MARPIRETPVLKGEDAFNFEMRRQEVEHIIFHLTYSIK